MKKQFIEEEINKLIETGSNKDSILKVKEMLETSEFYKDRSFDEIVNSFISELTISTEEFLNAKKDNVISYTSGISSLIYLPSYNNKNTIKVKFIGGSKSRTDVSLNVDIDTLFDVASITKLFTLVLLMKLEEYGYIDLNQQIAKDNSDFSGLKDFTYNDLIKLHGEIYTDGNVATASSIEEATKRLKTMHLISEDRTTNKYTDFGAIAMSKTIEKVMSEKLNQNLTFDQIMDKFLFKPFGLTKACFNPNCNIAGDGVVHDPKSRILGGAVGSAGLFINSDDLAHFAHELFIVNYVNYDKFKNIISKKNLDRLGEITYPNGNQPQKGNLGIYVKNDMDLSFCPMEYSKLSFAHQGWTGSVATFDPNNLIHSNILVNAIAPEVDKELKVNDKVAGFKDYFNSYSLSLSQISIMMLFTKKYFDKYYNEVNNIDITKKIK